MNDLIGNDKIDAFQYSVGDYGNPFDFYNPGAYITDYQDPYYGMDNPEQIPQGCEKRKCYDASGSAKDDLYKRELYAKDCGCGCWKGNVPIGSANGRGTGTACGCCQGKFSEMYTEQQNNQQSINSNSNANASVNTNASIEGYSKQREQREQQGEKTLKETFGENDTWVLIFLLFINFIVLAMILTACNKMAGLFMSMDFDKLAVSDK